MQKVSDEWISRTLAIAEENCGKYGTVEVLGRQLVLVLNELQACRKMAEIERLDRKSKEKKNE